MRVKQSIHPELKDVYKVSQWKWNIDEGSPWWKQFYFKHIFLRFLLFSLWLGIPAPKEVIIESDQQGRIRKTFRWFEDEGIFEHREQADAGCLGEHWGYTLLPYGRLMPPDSAQYSGTVFPRKKNPNKWAKPVLSLVIKDRKQDEKVKEEYSKCLQKLSQVLD